jgi:hypothetical protein
MRKIKLKTEDCIYILQKVSHIPKDVRRKLETYSLGNVELTARQASLLRDLVGDTLMKIGFDEGYAPNKDGVKLEDLVDKLYM